MESRAEIRPQLPHSHPTTTYWQTEPASISDLRTTSDLPHEAKYVIIGSGMSGSCVAYNLAKRLDPKDAAGIVILEARGVCSGATGRNGGHTKCATYTTFPVREENYGLAEASKIARLERANVSQMQQFAKQNDIDCDLHICNTVDVFFDQTDWERSEAVARKINMNVSEADNYKISGAKEAQLKYRVPKTLGALEYPAGSISAYKFTVGTLNLALADGVNLQTYTPVTKISPATDNASSRTWCVETSRGVVTTQNVIVTTNGYAAHLLDDLQGSIVPLRGQVVAQRPGSNMPSEGLPVTYSFRQKAGYEYMITRPPGSKFAGDIIVGGGLSKISNGGLSEFGNTDDSIVQPEASQWLYSCTEEFFGSENWGRDHPEGRVRHEWTGIMGYTADGIPYVGGMPSQEGVWVSAGFNGRGMTLCFKCAEALAAMVVGKEDDIADWLPESFRITPQRLNMQFTGFATHKNLVKTRQKDVESTNGHTLNTSGFTT